MSDINGQRIVYLLPALLLWITVSCGGPDASTLDVPTAAVTPETAGVEPRAPKGSVLRADVVAIVDGGLGGFLQLIAVEPSLEGGKFSGFRILELTPPSFWQNIDLAPGDVVTQINGKSIENPNTAFEVFESLRQAPKLHVVLTRNGETRQLLYPIIGAPLPNTKSQSTPAAPARP